MRLPPQRLNGVGLADEHLGAERDQVDGVASDERGISLPANFDSKIAAFLPPKLRERRSECREPGLPCRIAFLSGQQHADQPHLV